MNENQSTKKSNKKTIIVITVLIVITLTAIAVSIWALCFRNDDVVIAPDYAPKQLEPNAEPIKTDDKKLDHSDGGSSVGLVYTNEAIISLSKRTIEFLFINPSRSNQDMVIAFTVNDVALAVSGRLVAGRKLTKLTLVDGAEKIVMLGGYNAKLIVSFYDVVSGEKALVNTVIPVTITVVE